MYETKTVTATATDGTRLELVVPTDLPGNERAGYLRTLYKEHVRHPKTPANPTGNWKGRADAIVPAELAADVAEAMEFVGSIVDFRGTSADGKRVALISKGYWAHGF